MRRLVPLAAVLLTATCTQTNQTHVALTRAEVPPATVTSLAPALESIAPPAAPLAADDGSGGSDIDYAPRASHACNPVDVSAGPFQAAEALSETLAIFQNPGDGAAATSLRNPTPLGATRVLMVINRQGDWLDVLLPIRPNGSTGWVRASDVSVVQHSYRIVVQQSAHVITAYNGAEVIDQEPIGLGRAGTATPCGLYYVTDLLRPANPGGPFGPYAFGLSGFSEVLYSFGGGNGQIGLHGTNDPSGLGRNVSHGCIRMSNAGITRLAQVLPLGTPVYITA